MIDQILCGIYVFQSNLNYSLKVKVDMKYLRLCARPVHFTENKTSVESI